MKSFSGLLPVFLFFSLITPAQVSNPQLEFTNCFLDDCKYFGDDQRIQFAYLTVPEDYSNPAGRTLRLAVVIIKAANGNPEKDPIMHLTGGPGAKALHSDLLKFFRDHAFKQNRDLILMDFRGIGLSEPEFCPDLPNELEKITLADLTPDEASVRTSELFENCFNSLLASGIDLNMYNSATVVKDLELLRKSLGIEKWNLWGISYGTRLAQTYLRDSPLSIRSVIIDSPIPMGYPFWGGQVESYKNSLDAFFDACKKDPECNRVFPDLEQRFYRALETLKERPLTFNSEGITGVRGYYNFQDMHLVFQELLYDPASYAVIPWLIKGIEEHDDEIFRNIAFGMHQSVDVISPALGITVLKYDNGLMLKDTVTEPGEPLHNSLNYYDNIIGMVRNIGYIVQDTLETLRVESEIPCLILSGSQDPMTRPFHAKFLKSSLKNSFLLEFPGQGHGLTQSSECAINIGIGFLNNPDFVADTSCIESMKITPFSWATSIYHNPHIGTLVLQTVMENNWFPTGGIILLILGFLLILINALSYPFRKRTSSLTSRIRIRNIITKTSILLSMALIAGLGLLIGRTMDLNGSVILVGLVKEASFFLYLSLFVIAGTLSSVVWYIGSLKHSSLSGIIFYGFLCVSLLWCSAIIFHYQLLPQMVLHN